VDLDLVIVGGGPAGVATALFFVAVAPHLKDRIVILEKERYPRDKICAGAVGARADKALASIGVHVDVPSAPIFGLSVETIDGALMARDDEARAPIGRVVRRVEFDRALADEARGRGIRIVEGARATRVERTPSSVRIQSSAGDLTARAVIGADGVGSFVRRAIGAPRGRFHAQVIEVDTDAAPQDRARDLLHFDLRDPGLVGYAWDFPTIVGGRPLVCRGLYALHDELRDDEGVDARVARVDIGARLEARLAQQGVARAGLVFKRFAERGLSLAEPLARERALLVGEAAGIDPVLGEGIAQAILYGAAAGPYLARCLARDDLSFADWPRALFEARVGLDLRVRSAATRWVYGSTRRIVERWAASSRDLALAGMRYFAGERVPRTRLASAALALGKIALTSSRSAPSSSRARARR